MVFILDCNSEIGSRVRSNLSYLMCLRHLISHKSDFVIRFYNSIVSHGKNCKSNLKKQILSFYHGNYKRW